MRKTSFNQIVDGIDRQLSYLHKERWSRRHAELLETIRAITGEAQERAMALRFTTNVLNTTGPRSPQS